MGDGKGGVSVVQRLVAFVASFSLCTSWALSRLGVNKFFDLLRAKLNQPSPLHSHPSRMWKFSCAAKSMSLHLLTKRATPGCKMQRTPATPSPPPADAGRGVLRYRE